MELTWPKVISGGFVLVTAVSAATWQIRQDRISVLETTLSQCEQSRSLRFTEFAAEFRATEKSFSDLLVVQEQFIKLQIPYNELEKKYEAIQEQNRFLSEALQETQKKLLEKEQFINTLYSVQDSVSIKQGETVSYLGGELVIGVSNVSDSRASLVVQNKKFDMYTGQSLEVDAVKNYCKITLTETSSFLGIGQSVDLSLTCEQNKEK